MLRLRISDDQKYDIYDYYHNRIFYPILQSKKTSQRNKLHSLRQMRNLILVHEIRLEIVLEITLTDILKLHTPTNDEIT